MATYLIAGASRGIGLAFVQELLESQKDSKVIAGARKPAESEGLQALLKAYPSRLTLVTLDISDAKSVLDAAATVSKSFSSIDYLINNAAIIGAPKPTGDDLVSTLNTNVAGFYRVIQAFLPHVTKSKAKVIINVSSLVGVINNQMQQFVAGMFGNYGGANYYGYRISKSALNHLTVIMALDLAKDGITLINLHPGSVDSDGFRKEFKTPSEDLVKQFGIITTKESAVKQLEVIHKITIADSGKFFSYTGEVLQYA